MDESDHRLAVTRERREHGDHGRVAGRPYEAEVEERGRGVAEPSREVLAERPVLASIRGIEPARILQREEEDDQPEDERSHENQQQSSTDLRFPPHLFGVGHRRGTAVEDAVSGASTPTGSSTAYGRPPPIPEWRVAPTRRCAVVPGRIREGGCRYFEPAGG